MRFLVSKLDELIRSRSGVFEFTRDEGCLLRLQISQARYPLQLPDDRVEVGEPVLLIHMWNERLSTFSTGTTELAWASQFLRCLKRSFCLVADYLRENPHLNEIRAVGGTTILLTAGLHEGGTGVVQRLGFTVYPYYTHWGRFGEFWENFYSWLIIWTFNPNRLPDRSMLKLRRSEIWMSREIYLHRFGGKKENCYTI